MIEALEDLGGNKVFKLSCQSNLSPDPSVRLPPHHCLGLHLQVRHQICWSNGRFHPLLLQLNIDLHASEQSQSAATHHFRGPLIKRPGVVPTYPPAGLHPSPDGVAFNRNGRFGRKRRYWWIWSRKNWLWKRSKRLYLGHFKPSIKFNLIFVIR